MNGTPSMPPGAAGEVTGSVKVFILLGFLFLLFLFLSSSSVTQADLTPNNGTSSSAAQSTTNNQSNQSNVISIQGNGSNASSALVPVTGECTNPYTVQSGDYLSGIASLCNTTVAAIRAANPQITNINLIYPGQQLTIPSAAVAPTATGTGSLPVTGKNAPLNNVLQATPYVLPTQAVPAQSTPTISVGSAANVLQAGAPLQVTALHFPPLTPVDVALGPLKQGYNIVTSNVTDANGSLVTTITIPTPANPNLTQTSYVVVVTTKSQPITQAMSNPFYIAPQ